MAYYFIYSKFFKTIVKKLHFLLFFIVNEKCIPHFKFAPLDYGCSGVYLQKCKVTGNPISLIALLFCLKVAMSKLYHKIEFCNDTCTQNALWLN